MRSDPPGVTVAAWAGSTNLGDELVLAALLEKLRRRDVSPRVLSIDPARTRATHGVAASTTWSLTNPGSLESDAVLLGGGGLLQDETSPLNLPFHLGRARLAAIGGRPLAGIGLGAGPLTGPAGVLVRHTLSGAVAISVRDAGSQALLRSLGLTSTLAADLAVSLPPPGVPAAGRLAVALRPWTGRRSIVPVSRRRRSATTTPPWFLPGMAAALDDVVVRTGLAVHFVAFQSDRDGAVHRAVAARMRTAATFAAPDVDDVVTEVASCQAVVAMRYHAGIAALLGGRPAVLLGYSPKVSSLASEVPRGMAGLRWGPGAPPAVADALLPLLPAGEAVVEARERLRDRERANDGVLDRLLEAAEVR